MQKQSICFLGGGNMAQAIIARMVASDWSPEFIHVIDPNQEKLDFLSQKFKVHTHLKAGSWLAQIDSVLLAVKPQDLAEAINSISNWINDALVISIAAGVKTSDLTKLIGHGNICRVMPNTPVKIGDGVCGIFETDQAKDDHEFIVKVFASTGDLIWCEKEEMLESVTAISGSGPAYVFRFIEALEEVGKKYGFNGPQARRMAIATVLGAATLAKDSLEPVHELRQKVTSKGGTTYEALKVLEEKHFMEIMQQAMDACRKRAIELGDEFSQKL